MSRYVLEKSKSYVHVRLLSAILYYVVHKEEHWEEASDPRPHFLVKVCARTPPAASDHHNFYI